MGVKISKHGQVLATMKADKLQSAYSANNKKRKNVIKKELTKRGLLLEV